MQSIFILVRLHCILEHETALGQVWDLVYFHKAKDFIQVMKLKNFGSDM